MTKEELLALDPESALAAGFPLPPSLEADAALAFSDQLRAEGVPVEALELVVTMLHLASEHQSWERLRQSLNGVPRTPRFTLWARALGARVVDRASLEAAIEWVLKARRLRLFEDVLR